MMIVGGKGVLSNTEQWTMYVTRSEEKIEPLVINIIKDKA